MEQTTIEIARGDGRVIEVTATWPIDIPVQNITAGDPYPLDSGTTYFTARNKYNEATTITPVIAKTTGSGITVRAAPNNHIADVTITSADTENLTQKRLFWDVRHKPTGQDPLTLAEGVFRIDPNSTRI
jgi:hypothetical protein